LFIFPITSGNNTSYGSSMYGRPATQRWASPCSEISADRVPDRVTESRGNAKMRLKFALAMLLSAIVVFASPAGATRTDSGYSPDPGATPMPFPGGVYWLWASTLCGDSAPACSHSNGSFDVGTDLFVEITPNSLSLPLDVTLDLSESFDATFTPDSPFGQIDCATSTL